MLGIGALGQYALAQFPASPVPVPPPIVAGSGRYSEGWPSFKKKRWKTYESSEALEEILEAPSQPSPEPEKAAQPDTIHDRRAAEGELATPLFGKKPAPTLESAAARTAKTRAYVQQLVREAQLKAALEEEEDEEDAIFLLLQ